MFCLPIVLVCPRYFSNILRRQLNTLQKSGNIGFGKRPTVLHSVLDGQVCVGRDEGSKKGVGVKARSLVKVCVPADVPRDAEPIQLDDRYETNDYREPTHPLHTVGGLQIEWVRWVCAWVSACVYVDNGWSLHFPS